jgi:predicted RNase H-like nuclease (RuvC/YqgF family)
MDNEELKDENARLKAEVERLTKAVMHSPAAQLKLKELEGKNTYEEINPKEDENARLKAEVERMNRALEEEAACQVGHQENAILIGRLEAQVERLTKAGDAMAGEFSFIGSSNGGFNSIDNWNAAKEGKQSNG